MNTEIKENYVSLLNSLLANAETISSSSYTALLALAKSLGLDERTIVGAITTSDGYRYRFEHPNMLYDGQKVTIVPGLWRED